MSVYFYVKKRLQCKYNKSSQNGNQFKLKITQFILVSLQERQQSFKCKLLKFAFQAGQKLCDITIPPCSLFTHSSFDRNLPPQTPIKGLTVKKVCQELDILLLEYLKHKIWRNHVNADWLNGADLKMFDYLCPKLSEEYQEEAKIFITALSWSFQETAEVLGHIVREITFMPVKALTKRETSINKNRLVSPDDKTGYINNQMNFT